MEQKDWQFLAPAYNSYLETGARYFTYSGYDRGRWLETAAMLRRLADGGWVDEVSGFVFADVLPDGMPSIHFALTACGIDAMMRGRAQCGVDGWPELV